MDYYTELTNAAKEHQYLYHYTNVESLRLILENQSLRLSRIDIVNDYFENKRITSHWNRNIFLLCFTYTLENSDLFFSEYGKIRLEFNREDFESCKFFLDPCKKYPVYNHDANRVLNNKYCKINDDVCWYIYDVTLANIKYSSNLDSEKAVDNFESNAGLIKSSIGYDKYNRLRAWKDECECRLRVAIQPDIFNAYYDRECKSMRYLYPNFTYIFTSLPQISRISISPDICSDEKKNITLLIKQFGLIDKLNTGE